MNPSQRIEYRKSLPQVSIWDFSSSSEEDVPKKKPKHSESESNPIQADIEPPIKEYGPTYKHEIKPINPKLLEHLGYVNRNNRPPSSKKNEIHATPDLKKHKILPSLEDRKNKETEKITQIKLMLEAQKK
jgi:hypothetical protein